MVFLFYISGITAVLSTGCVIFNVCPMYALLYLIVSFLSISCIFFSLGAVFSGAIEIIIYAGAIMILFIFVIMMLNTEDIYFKDNQENKFLNFKLCVGTILLSSTLCIIMLCFLMKSKNSYIDTAGLNVDIYHIGYKLFGYYILTVEIASFLLLGALISILHISQCFNKKR